MFSIIKKFIDEHHTIRKVLKQAFVGGGIAFLTIIMNAQVEIVSSVPEYSAMFVLLFALVNGLLNYLKHNFNF